MLSSLEIKSIDDIFSVIKTKSKPISKEKIEVPLKKSEKSSFFLCLR